MNKAALETALRNDVLAAINDFLREHYETDVLTVSASEITIPILDAEGNEKFALIKVSIPRGTRCDGGYTPYDGYAAADDYADELKEKEAKRAASAEKKAMAEKLREQKRAIRAAKKLEKDDSNQHTDKEIAV